MVVLPTVTKCQYGSIADRNKVLVDKCKDYMDRNPETVPRILDKEEFDRDYAARKQMELPARSLNSIIEKLEDTKTVLSKNWKTPKPCSTTIITKQQ